MIEKLIEYNKHWAGMQNLQDETYFQRLSEGQAPEYLWIGCSDSRVPAESVLGVKPGQLFVHRNIANQVKLDDNNSMSVLQYAVDVLKVSHVIICGHSGCGGVQAAFEGTSDRYVADWLSDLRQLTVEKADELAKKSNDEEKLTLLTELNVQKQVELVANHEIVRNAWQRNQDLAVHGWVFRIDTGCVKNLNISVNSQA